VQAISRSGTNIPSGSVYGYFRDSKFNAKDFVVKQVVPCANQQIGGAIGGPLIKDKMHFFANYERENEPNTIISKPPALGGQTGIFATKTVQPSFLGRIDYQVSARDHLVFRATYWSFNNTFDEVLGTDYPTSAARRERDSNILTGNWSRVVNSNTTPEVKGGFYHYHWTHVLADGVPSLPTYSFPNFSVISHSNYPEEFWQNMQSARADVN
jgi:hypothetical protein